MMKTPLSIVRVAALCVPLVLVASCGGDGSSALPGSTVSIQVPETTWNVPYGALLSTQNEPVLISLKSSTGYQLGGSDIHISLDLSPASYSGTTPPMRLFEENSPGDNNFTKELTPMPYTTQTDGSGNKVLLLNMRLGSGAGTNPSYKGTLYVYSGSAVGTSSFEVKCIPPAGANPPPC